MSSLFNIEKAISQKNYRLAINILEKKLASENDSLYFYILGKCYLQIKDYEKAYYNIQKSVNLNPYGIYKEEIFSLTLNELAISKNVETKRKKIILDIYDRKSVHAIALYPLADVYFLDNINDCINPDYFIIPNWLSPYHPVYEKIDSLSCPVISLVVDRLFHAEEHIKSNLIYSDIIVVMENYAVELLKKQGFTNVIYYPCAGSVGYDPLAYPKLNNEKKIYDIVFLGNISDSLMYKNRRKMLNKLESLKNKYNIIIKSVSDYNEYWTITNQAKIVIDHTIDSKALNYRMFQALGIGTLCFVEENEMVSELYNDKEDLIMYNLNNLESLIDYYLKNDLERELIAKSGQIKTINNYTHYHILKGLLDKVEENNFIFPSQKTNNTNFDLYKGISKYYQNKYQDSLDIFNKLQENIEIINNKMVNLIKIMESSKFNYDNEITNIYNNNKEYLLISFNYFLYLKYVKNQDISHLINSSSLKKSIGLVFLPENNKKFIDEFKIKHGEIIFDYGINSDEYINKFYNLIEYLKKSYFIS